MNGHSIVVVAIKSDSRREPSDDDALKRSTTWKCQVSWWVHKCSLESVSSKDTGRLVARLVRLVGGGKLM